MKQFHFKPKRRILILFIIVLILAVASTIGLIVRSRTEAAPAEPKVGAAVPSEFKFTGAADWWQGATNKTSMALFHKIEDSCFVSVQHRTGSMTADQAMFQKSQTELVSTGHVIDPIATPTLTLQTSTGSQDYQLTQSSVSSPDSADKILGGQEFGYLQLSKGFLYIEGYCDTPAELAETLPALQAITFDAAR